MSKRVFYNLYDLWSNGVKPRDMRARDSEMDLGRHGYWVEPGSPTQTILSLKGCQPSKMPSPSISRAIGYEDTKFLGD